MTALESLDAYAYEEIGRRLACSDFRKTAAPKAIAALCAVLDEADKAEHGATRWADPLPVPEWVNAVRAAIASELAKP